MNSFTKKLSSKEIDHWTKTYNDMSDSGKESWKKSNEAECEKFYESEEHKSGDTTYLGYVWCCDLMGFCGGMSGWIIFLIILLVLGALAGGAAAFYFFYWKRKN